MNKFESGDTKRKKSHVKNLIKMASADGHVDGSELEFLNKIARKFGVDQDEVQHIIDNPDQYSFTPPATKEERHAQLLNLTLMMLADNVIDDNEMKIMKKFAVGLGYPFGKVDRLIQKAIELAKQDIDEDDAIDELDEV